MPLRPGEIAIAAVLFGTLIWVIGAYKIGDCIRELDRGDRPEDSRKPATGLSALLRRLAWLVPDLFPLLLLCLFLPVFPLMILFFGLRTLFIHRELIRSHWPRFRAPLALWSTGCMLVMYGATWLAIFLLEHTGALWNWGGGSVALP